MAFRFESRGSRGSGGQGGRALRALPVTNDRWRGNAAGRRHERRWSVKQGSFNAGHTPASAASDGAKAHIRSAIISIVARVPERR